MPDFTPDDIDIDPSEFVYACNSREIKELIDTLVEDGHISPDRKELNSNTGVRNPNHYDETFWESLDHLAKCRDMLTIGEETFINELANKFKHLR
jgi:hypothetical protein